LYKYLLCWRYLRTRYIALASIISVMLGVATMIVVNAVMAGFAEKMRDRLHGVLADVVVESFSLDGFYDSDEVMARIRDVAGADVAAMAPTMETLGIMQVTLNGQPVNHPVQIIGIRPEERAKTGDFAEFLFDQKGRPIRPSFEVPESLRLAGSPAGHMLQEFRKQKEANGESDPIDALLEQELKKEAEDQSPAQGAIIGYALATYHQGHDQPDLFLSPMGSKINLVFPTGGRKPKPGLDDYTVVGYFKSGMSEYDSMHVYVPLEQLQRARYLQGMDGKGAVNQIQIKVQPGVDLDRLAMRIQDELDLFRPRMFRVSTWEQKQGPLLGAVAIEQSILNILLFFIIAVAGFGILAIFSMIVVEKTRDIGVLKSLGASTAGVRGIFLGYGLLLGAVGSGVGMAGGLLFVHYINDIEGFLSRVLQRRVFDDSIYYFNEIPTLVNPFTVAWIVVGALVIAVGASVWPAQRAARLHPVQALRFE
jgi:lipoprotein-releasing system permease protein